MCDAAGLRAIWTAAQAVQVDPRLRRYCIALVHASRAQPGTIALGVSPRGGLALQSAARARALMDSRDFVIPEDIYALAPAVFRHRLILSFDAEADGLSGSLIATRLLQTVPSP